MNSSKRGAAYGFRLQSLDLVSKTQTASSLQHTNISVSVSLFLSEAVGHQIHRPEADAAALHRQHHPGEIPAGPGLLHRAALPGQGGAG